MTLRPLRLRGEEMVEQLDLDGLTLRASLTQEEAHAARILRRHAGRAQAIPGEALAWIIGVSDKRQVRAIVHTLREVHHLPIGSVTTPPGGYYWMVAVGEIERNFWSLIRRAAEILRAAHATRKSPLLAGMIGQLDLYVNRQGAKDAMVG